MSGPITWQNINGPSLSEASRPMEAAARSINDGFNVFQQTLANRERVQMQQANDLKTFNTQDYLNKVAELGKTPEALQAAMQSGALDQLRAGYGPAIDHNATRGAAEALLATRYAQTKQANEYKDYARDQSEQPIIDQIGVLTAQGKTAEAKALLEQHQLRKEAGLYAGLDQRDQLGVERDRSTKEFGFKEAEQKLKGEKFLLDKKVADAQIRSSDASAAASAAASRRGDKELNLREQEIDERRLDRIGEMLGANTDRMGKIRSLDPTSSGGVETINKFISEIKDPYVQALARESVPKMVAVKGVTTSDVMVGLMKIHGEGWWNSPEGNILNTKADRRTNALNAATESSKTESSVQSRLTAEQQKANVLEQGLKLELRQARIEAKTDKTAQIRVNKLEKRLGIQKELEDSRRD